MQKINPIRLCDPWVDYKIKQFFTNMRIKQTTLTCNTKKCKGLNQWAFVSLGLTLTYTTTTVSNLRNCLESNQCIDDTMQNNQNWHPRHDLPQICGGNKSVCPVWIHITDNFLTHPRTSFRINELWSNKYDTHKS